jgi:hypothetical protein
MEEDGWGGHGPKTGRGAIEEGEEEEKKDYKYAKQPFPNTL